MDYKPHVLLDEPLKMEVGPTRLHESIRMHLGYLVLGLICLSVTLLAFPMRALLPRALSRRLGRRLVTRVTRVYLHFLVRMGACRFDLSALDPLRDGPAMVIAPNHPCLLDAVMILSRLPNAACIMKAELVNSVFFGAGARLAGYIRNTPLRTMVQLAVDDLRHGNHLLLFPEGTRTTRFPIGDMQGTTGLIAKKAGVSVQTVFIETDSGFLGKGWSLLWTPKMPITYRVRLGKRFDPPCDTAEFVSELEHYFQSELAHAKLPGFPVKAPPA
ncbi:MAG: 1-acyl-sn-glycerol-3-phosphate acyltransferase [Haliea sp.]|nr:MAG: 1-acyl-sn-glycerol-3-phosphate acyltransferase [Haliea sp.]